MRVDDFQIPGCDSDGGGDGDDVDGDGWWESRGEREEGVEWDETWRVHDGFMAWEWFGLLPGTKRALYQLHYGGWSLPQPSPDGRRGRWRAQSRPAFCLEGFGSRKGMHGPQTTLAVASKSRYVPLLPYLTSHTRKIDQGLIFDRFYF